MISGFIKNWRVKQLVPKIKGCQGFVLAAKKIKGGKQIDIDCITFVVEKKVPKHEITKDQLIPEKIAGMPTDVIESGGDILPLFRAKHRPIKGGISGKVETGTACSIGLICFKDGEPHALTNEHCVHYTGDMTGKRFIQPSPMDGGKKEDVIGTIKYPPRIKTGEINKLDSNIVPLDKNIPYELLIHEYGDYPKKWAKPRVGARFKKVGRTTGITEGTISHINANAWVNFSFQGLGAVQFYPCIFALQENYSIVNGGDSGSCIFNREGVIGQTFAAAPNLAIFLTGEVIRDELGIVLSPPEEGYIALGNWLLFKGLEITTKEKTNLRSSPEIMDNIIKILPTGVKIKILGFGGIKSGYVWLKVVEET